MTRTGFCVGPLDDEGLEPYCQCLEGWSEEIREAGDLKCRWVEEMADKGLGVQLARADDGTYVGMVQYIPAEYSTVDAPGQYHIHCCWVHAHKGKGVGDWRGQGVGKALMKAAEEDLRSRGALGVTAWGLTIPAWMRASWYKKHGFRRVDRDGIAALMWKPFTDEAVMPRWRRPSEDLNSASRGSTPEILSLVGGVCPAVNAGQERMRQLVEDYGDKVSYRRLEIRTPDEIVRWGVTDALYINGRPVQMGPPPSVKKLRNLVDKAIRKSR